MQLCNIIMRHTQVHAHLIGTECILTHFWVGTTAPAENKRWHQPGLEIRSYSFETSSLQCPQQSTLHYPGLIRTPLALLPLLCHFFLTCKLRRAERSWAPWWADLLTLPTKRDVSRWRQTIMNPDSYNFNKWGASRFKLRAAQEPGSTSRWMNLRPESD